jgi:hypothetical protein
LFAVQLYDGIVLNPEWLSIFDLKPMIPTAGFYFVERKFDISVSIMFDSNCANWPRQADFESKMIGGDTSKIDDWRGCLKNWYRNRRFWESR